MDNQPVDFKNINPELYRHPGEREALAGLAKIPGFAKAVAMMSEAGSGQADRQAVVASMLRVGPGAHPVLAELWNKTLALFGLGNVPLYVAFHLPQPWSVRGGNDNPFLVLSADLLDSLPEREMAALLATQAGAIRLGNATHLGAADFLRWLADFSGLFGAPAAMLGWGVENWRRYAAFSADRAAALALGDPGPVVALLERLSGGGSRAWGDIANPDSLRLQGIEAKSFGDDWSNSRWRRFILAMNRQNQVGLVRRLDLLDWFASGEPARILRGETTIPPHEGQTAHHFSSGGAKPDAEPEEDSGLAFWGNFAAPGSGAADADPSGCNCPAAALFGMKSCPMASMMGAAGKGLDTFKKAGEAFFKTVQDTLRK